MLIFDIDIQNTFPIFRTYTPILYTLRYPIR
nr:MAG TPA: hypothetical protein [Caudoviricetes sp.]